MSAQEFSRVFSLAASAAGLRLLVLHGSRARGDHRAESDWDFAYLADATFDTDSLLGKLGELLGGRVELVDLDRAPALFRFKAAADGIRIYPADERVFNAYRLEAIINWCDMEPVLTRLYDAEIRKLAR